MNPNIQVCHSGLDPESSFLVEKFKMEIIKFIHVGCAVLSISGFVVRGFWMINESPWLNEKSVKVAPHIIDTLLIITAIILAWHVAQFPFIDNWLTAKLVALLVYIGLGMVALHRGKNKQQRVIAFVLAIVTYAYILSVAITRSPILFA